MSTGRLWDIWIPKPNNAAFFKYSGGSAGSDISLPTPYSLLVTSKNKIAVTDGTNKYVYFYDYTGSYLGRTAQFSTYAYTLAEDADGFIWTILSGGGTTALKINQDTFAHTEINLGKSARSIFIDAFSNPRPVFPTALGKIIGTSYDAANDITVGTSLQNGCSLKDGTIYLSDLSYGLHQVMGTSIIASIPFSGNSARQLCVNNNDFVCATQISNYGCYIVDGTTANYVDLSDLSQNPYSACSTPDGKFYLLGNSSEIIEITGTTRTNYDDLGTLRFSNTSGDSTGMTWEYLFGGASPQYSYAI